MTDAETRPRPTIRPHQTACETRPDGTLILSCGFGLGEVAPTTLHWLDHWAEAAPERVFLAERSGPGWREVSFAEAAGLVAALATGLMARGIVAGDRIVVLSGPSVDHGLLTLAAQSIGAVTVPLAEQYSLIPDAAPRLAYCLSKVHPKLVYAEDGVAYARALEHELLAGAMKVVGASPGEGMERLSDLMAATDTAAVAAARAHVGPQTLAKILFTSGSTSDPKGVPQSQGMMCVNQAQYLACLPMLGERPHKLLSWLPWNHVFAGSSDFNMALSNGASLYLDDGKPVDRLFARTLENLAMHPPTLQMDVPVAHAMTMAALREDPELRARYFEDLDLFFYAGASLPSDVWEAVEEMSREITGDVPMMISSWGMTETAPMALIYHEKGAKSGMIGVPAPGLSAKLLPLGAGRYELRVKGPNVIDGYYEDPVRTAESFDDEGYFVTGDAVHFVDPDDPSRGLIFDGRLTEDFKLATGTFVRATTLRVRLLAALAGLVQDVVVVGEGRGEVGLLVFPSAGRFPGGPPDDGAGAVVDAGYAAELQAVLGRLAAQATGSSMRIARAIVLAAPPSVGEGEITPKGSINTRTVARRRAAMIDRLYDDADPAVVRV